MVRNGSKSGFLFVCCTVVIQQIREMRRVERAQRDEFPNEFPYQSPHWYQLPTMFFINALTNVLIKCLMNVPYRFSYEFHSPFS